MEAVRLLQVEIQSIIRKELGKVKMETHKIEDEKILLEQKVEKLLKQHEEEIKGLKAVITEKEEHMINRQKDQEAEIKMIKESCKEKIKEIKEANAAKEVMKQMTEDIETLKTDIRSSRSLIEEQESALQKVTLLATTWKEGSYCILANGDCPPGFSRSEGYAHAVSVWSCSGSISPATFGDSYFRHHRQCNHGNYADITIVACCK